MARQVARDEGREVGRIFRRKRGSRVLGLPGAHLFLEEGDFPIRPLAGGFPRVVTRTKARHAGDSRSSPGCGQAEEVGMDATLTLAGQLEDGTPVWMLATIDEAEEAILDEILAAPLPAWAAALEV